MSENTSTKIPTWFWIVAGLALLWNLFGVLNFIGQLTASPEDLAQRPEFEQAIIENRPFWVTAAFGIAVITGTLGSLFLLLRKSWATITLMISLIAVLIQTSYNFLGTDNAEAFGAAGLGLALSIILVAVGLVWLARKSQANGWIS